MKVTPVEGAIRVGDTISGGGLDGYVVRSMVQTESATPPPAPPPRDPSLHECQGHTPQDGYGEALNVCWEQPGGKLWAGNEEYGSQVAFCPYCGFKAKVPPPVEVFDPNLKKYVPKEQPPCPSST